MNLINFISQLFELAQTDAGKSFTSKCSENSNSYC